jgi:hypothetical protein
MTVWPSRRASASSRSRRARASCTSGIPASRLIVGIGDCGLGGLPILISLAGEKTNLNMRAWVNLIVSLLARRRGRVEECFGGGGVIGWCGVPFGFAQGRLSTAFGWRLTSLRMTMGFKADIIPDRRQLREVRSKSSARADGRDTRHSITHFAQDDKKGLRGWERAGQHGRGRPRYRERLC